MSHLSRRLGAALSALALTAAGLVAASSGQPASAAACSNTRNSTMTFRGTGTTIRYASWYQDGHPVTESDPLVLRGKHDVGGAAISVVACQDPKTKAWHALQITYKQTYNDLTVTTTGSSVTVSPAHGSFGDALRVKTITTNRINGVGVICYHQTTSLGVLGAAALLLSLPVKGLPYGASVGKFILGKVISGASRSAKKSPCGEMYVPYSIPWHFAGNGVATLGAIRSDNYAFNRRVVDTSPPTCQHTGCQILQDDQIFLRKG